MRYQNESLSIVFRLKTLTRSYFRRFGTFDSLIFGLFNHDQEKFSCNKFRFFRILTNFLLMLEYRKKIFCFFCLKTFFFALLKLQWQNKVAICSLVVIFYLSILQKAILGFTMYKFVMYVHCINFPGISRDKV